MAMKIKPWALGGITVFWVVMTSLFIRREFFEFTPLTSSWEVLPIHGSDLRTEYHGIYLGKELIGFNLTALEKKNDPAGPPYELRHNTYLTFRFLGQEREMLVRGKASLAATLELADFSLLMTDRSTETLISGSTEGNRLLLEIKPGHGEPARREIPVESPLFYSESLSMIWSPANLRPGKKGQFQLWNPLALGLETIEFRTGEKTRILHEGREAEVYPISLSSGGTESRYWCTPEGLVLKHESPTGLVMLMQEAWKIFDRMRETREALPDLPNLYSLPSNRELKNPGKLTRLKVRVNEPSGERILETRKIDLADVRALPWPVEDPGPDEAPYLEPDWLIQSKDPEIIRRARMIAGDEKTVVGASLKIMKWVHEWISPAPSMNLPSARTVLETRLGDCNEYTALFTALARALGIPARMTAGVVYRNGRFYYHAWPEVYAGVWIGLDPTFAEAPAGPAHIPLLTGNLQEHIQLARTLNQIQIVVLEAE